MTLPRNSTASSAPTMLIGSDDGGSEAAEALSAEDRQELKRLHHLGIPVPGIKVTVDKWSAKVWLEDLEVECANHALRARVKAVVERGVETVSGLWS